ncbi:DoxX family protein [Streptomyces sp. ST2-7A]|uniref:DoxX family protein n=1 Tax=Streptomyces sp. ST2-7A TaxID=2907214 RepID=UPI001F1639C4|nr:DoxX family protein [Streptomyces sp. ST2-7A]MCE7078716.1 DoxX family protein [Streptomyces sp. ST2-7A]
MAATGRTITQPGGGDPDGSPPPVSRWALLPLRLFLGLTFLYAGIDKYTSWGPFSAAMDQRAIETMLEFGRDRAALPWMVDLVLANPGPFGHAVAVAEIAVGAGVLLGVLTRLAALGGALLSLSFWLTVSWSTDPYYFGPDLPYLFGFLTLVLAGAGAHSVDARRTARHRRTGSKLYG